jgi:hypothetical protein
LVIGRLIVANKSLITNLPITNHQSPTTKKR